MSRTSRVPYHQNVYDLLGIEPAVCPEATEVIAEHEAAYGPLPASVREWYSVPRMVVLEGPDDDDQDFGEGTIWYDYLPHDIGNQYRVRSLIDVLQRLALAQYGRPPRLASFLNTTGYYAWTWHVKLDESDDPPVWITGEGTDLSAELPQQDGTPFSRFLTNQFGNFYRNEFCPGYVERPSGAPPVHANGLWLRTPDEPFHPPAVDFLTERLGDPHLTPLAGNVTTYTWRPAGGTVRVTADEPGLTGGLSAWWVHAEAPERLAEFAELLVPWGTLRETLRADTDLARAVLDCAKT